MNATEKVAATLAAKDLDECFTRGLGDPEMWDADEEDRGYYLARAEAVVGAVRAMSPGDLAELIGGEVDERTRGMYGPVTDRRVVGPWQETP